MNIEVMEKKLYDACLEGDVETLEALMKDDKLTLARVSLSSRFNQTPLHLASLLGHFEFAKSLLSYNHDSASNLDLQGRSALHLASANGYLNIVQLLIEYDQKMCQLCDEDGRTPLHLAVLKGQEECVGALLKVHSESDQQRKMLHLSVKYNRLNVLILILESSDQNLSNIKHDDGNTILHSATALRRMQIIKYLVKCRSEVELNSVNENGLTALDIIEEMPKDVKTTEIKEFLISANALRAKEIKAAVTANLIPGVDGVANDNKLVKMWKQVKNSSLFHEQVEKEDKNLLVGASVIAAMAYAAAISPPGGVTAFDADDYSNPDTDISFLLAPASSLLAYFWPGLSNLFWISNTISFMAALSVIFMYVSGASLKKKILVRLIRGAMWITLTSMTTAYVSAVVATSPDYGKDPKKSYKHNKTILALAIGLFAWIAMIIAAVSIAAYPWVRSVVTKIMKRKTTRNKINTNEDHAATGATPITTHIV